MSFDTKNTAPVSPEDLTPFLELNTPTKDPLARARRDYMYSLFIDFEGVLVDGLQLLDGSTLPSEIPHATSPELETRIRGLSKGVAEQCKNRTEHLLKKEVDLVARVLSGDLSIINNVIHPVCAGTIEAEIVRHSPHYKQLLTDLLGMDEPDPNVYLYPQMKGTSIQDEKVFISPGYSRQSFLEILNSRFRELSSIIAPKLDKHLEQSAAAAEAEIGNIALILMDANEHVVGALGFLAERTAEEASRNATLGEKKLLNYCLHVHRDKQFVTPD